MGFSSSGNIIMCVLFIVENYCQDLSNDITGGKGPRIVSLKVRSDILYRFAETVVTSTVVNDLFDARETTFDVNIPEAAFISNFTLEVDGIIYPSTVKEKDAAKKTYDKAKLKGESAGHVFYKPRDSNKFRININVAALSEVTFMLTYDELLQRKRGQYEHVIYVDPKQVVDQLLIEVYIFESREITALRIPPVRNDIPLNTFEISTSNELAIVERPSPKSAYIRFNPSVDEQKRDSLQGISGLFKVQYDVQRSLDAGDIYIVDGYFTHFFAPVGLYPLRKRILFVLDISGSMSFNRKITQLKEAMTQILAELNEEDLFNIVTFESNSLPWKSIMKKATKDNRDAATTFVQNLIAEGGTNVHNAIMDALNILQNTNESGVNAPIIIFLSDGDPTVGETNLHTILNSIEDNNKQKVQIFSLGFGEDANYEFLKKISARNNAFARKIYADADANLQMTGFYNEISNVLLSKVSFTYLDDTVNLTTITQSQFSSFFDGSELIVSGRINELDPNFNTLTATVVGVGNKGTIELSSSTDIWKHEQNSITDFKTRLDFSTITEKTWAYLTVNKLLEEMLKTENRLLKEEIKNDAVNLAIKYNFVTPVTSMVVTKPEKKMNNDTYLNVQEDDANAIDDSEANSHAALRSHPGPQSLTGMDAYANTKALADNDPHFIVKVKGLDYAICFDVMGEEGDEFELINDKYSGLEVTAKVIANKPALTGTDDNERHSHTWEIKTFLGEITIKRWRFVAHITPTNVTLSGETIDWTNGTTLSHGSTDIIVDHEGSKMVMFFNDRVTLMIIRHLKPKLQLLAGKVNFLGIYVVDYKGLSFHTHGLLGQFLHRTVVLTKTKNRNGRLMGRLRVSGNTQRPRKVMARMGHRLNLATNKPESCWMVQNNGSSLIDGSITDYLINRKSGVENDKQSSTDEDEHKIYEAEFYNSDIND